MAKKFTYSKRLSATTTEQELQFPVKMKRVVLRNLGSDSVDVEFNNAVDGDSFRIPSGEQLEINTTFDVLHYKCPSSTATLGVFGEKTIKDTN